MNIGLTGGIACGKSTVSAMLVRRGAILIDADAIAREIVLPGMPALQEIANRFGMDKLLEDGSLDRKKLGSVIFADETARRDLESILHPAIRRTMRERMDAAEKVQPDKLVVVDVPLLYESDLQFMFEAVMVVYIPEDLQITRLMKRDGYSREQAEMRLNSQLSVEEKRRRADYVIFNDKDIAETERQVEAFWRERGLQ
ncbi:dephospho-CoA kinase [Gorillibacterium massiliense]|uniref:dephospho-CoA kinase n=1 Tax=Gorillibacterium massiliense TaxID=1280390 RepID=UPI000594ADE1|nr:dephospho-CoA kinase [Gorillibacterium massiliense]